MLSVFLYISYVLILFSFLVVVFPTLYVSELAISFLPYIVGMHIFLVGYRLPKLFIIQWNLRWFGLVILHILGFIYFVFPVYNFYTQSDLIGESSDTGMTILYANISKKNRNYTGLIEMIQDKDPDVVMFVEFADHHDEHIKWFLSENYPYINRTSRSKKFVGSMVFSKYPVDDLADEFVQGAWRYGYFRIDGPVGAYYVYLVHTSSPISPVNYRMRNDQLLAVADHISVHSGSREWNVPVLLLGDLNISPWSTFYNRFVADLENFSNITARFPIVFSWRLKRVPLRWSHIDHVFSTDTNAIGYIEQVDVPGSDHLGYYFIVK